MTKAKAVPGQGPNRGGRDRAARLPGWVPDAARIYLAHVEGGLTIRQLAREAQVHPSTILRAVRRVESSRDDPLVDEALRNLAGRAPSLPSEERALAARAVPALRRLAEPDTVLAIARDMENGVILREREGTEPLRLLVLDSGLAESMALRGWIDCPRLDARIRRYRITNPGREVLRREVAQEARRGLAEAATPFRHEAEEEDPHLSHLRSVLPETPLLSLARRRDGDGQPFLGRDLVAAGERLREEFDLAETVPGIDWEAALEELGAGRVPMARARGTGPTGALDRVLRALSDLGPGLADVALRCCCLLEGLEGVERRMGWSSRSGKIVLRIALLRLRQHYAERAAEEGSMIG